MQTPINWLQKHINILQVIEAVKKGKESDSHFEGSEKIGAHAIEVLKTYSDEEIETLVVAQGFTLFFAGSDTSSHVLGMISHFLALNQDVQEKLYQEVMDVMEENGGDQHLDYDALHKLTYMDKVIKESLRSQSLSFLQRQCTKDYYIPEIDFTVPKGMVIMCAGAHMMKEQQHFPNPHEYDPEGNFPTDTVTPPAFLSFGQGPRHCVGMRLAFVLVKVALTRTLANYKILPSAKTIRGPLEVDPHSRSALPLGGYHFKIQKRL